MKLINSKIKILLFCAAFFSMSLIGCTKDAPKKDETKDKKEDPKDKKEKKHDHEHKEGDGHVH
jgi:hypothetical protein